MNYLISILIMGVLSSCGIQKVAEETRKQVESSNDKQDKMIQEMQGMYTLTDKMLKEMGTTNNGVHLQILTGALQQMLTPANTENINPPSRIMPFADSFVKEATPDEIIQTYHTFLTDVEHCLEEDPKACGEGGKRRRMISFAVASALAGFTPREKFQSILKNEIENRGRFQDTAYIFSLSRYYFIRDYLFDSVVLRMKSINVEGLKKAVEYFSDLKYIVHLPYVNKMEFKVSALGLEGKVEKDDLRVLSNRAINKYTVSGGHGKPRKLHPDLKEAKEAMDSISELKKL